MNSDISTRFWPKVQKTDGCWNWIGGSRGNGYGSIHLDGKVVDAHRVSWLLHHGMMPEECVLHRCDNRLCVRPDHLFLGDRQENARDMRDKDYVCRSLYGCRLTAPQVSELKRCFQAGLSVRSTAKLLSMPPITVRKEFTGLRAGEPLTRRQRRSRFRGVTWRQRRAGQPCWRAEIHPRRKHIHVGYFETEEEAARAYDAAALEHFGPDAALNFR